MTFAMPLLMVAGLAGCTLVDDEIPLNAGCLKPLKIIIPEGCMLNPRYPAAVVAGNVETSQSITEALYGALGVMAASQGTMNNFTFGNQRHQYYETICGGSGAGPDFDGTDAIHTHMTNTRLTDPEILEWRHPVMLESFTIRAGSGGAGARRGGCGVMNRITAIPSSASPAENQNSRRRPNSAAITGPMTIEIMKLAPIDMPMIAMMRRRTSSRVRSAASAMTAAAMAPSPCSARPAMTW